MKRVFIAGSRKFYAQIEHIAQELKKRGVDGLTPMKEKDVDNFEHERRALFTAFEMISTSDYVYIVAEGGYVGRAVVIEMAYAYAKGVPIISSEEIIELSARALVNDVQAIHGFLMRFDWLQN